MLSPITTITLASLTLAALLLRVFWLHIPPKLQQNLLRVAIVLLLVELVFTVTKWSTSYAYVNVLLKWAAVVSYELLLILFTRWQPKLLTSLCAVILLVPLFAASVLMQLNALFEPVTSESVSFGNSLTYERNNWGRATPGNSGEDLVIFYQPRLLPFFRHELVHVPFNNHQCNAAASYAELGPTPKTILAHCPYWEGPGSEDRLLPLRRRP